MEMRKTVLCGFGKFFRFGPVAAGILTALVFTACPNPASDDNDDGPPPLGDARLAVLSAEPGNLSPAFCPDKTDYVMNTPHNLEDISVEGKAQEADAVVEGGGIHTLAVGQNPIAIRVTTAAGLEKTYTITVNRAGANASADAALKSLSIAPGILDRPFNANTRQYQAALPHRVESVEISAGPSHEGATISGAGTHALEVGANDFEIIVTAPAGNYVVYTVRARRASAEAGGSDDVSLSILKLLDGTEELAALDLEDLNGRYEYTAGAETGAVSIDAAASSSYAGMALSVEPPEAWSDGEIFLRADITVATLTVTAGDGETVKTYSITIKRPEKSADSSLASLALEGAELNPPFDPAVLAYSVSVPNTYYQPLITALPKHRLAVVETDAPDFLSAGDSRITVTVTPETGEAKTYTIDISRARNTDANLVGLAASAGSFDMPFSANTLEYTLDVPGDIASVTITAAPSSNVAVVGDAAPGEAQSVAADLVSGERRVISFTVTAESGFTKTYRVNAVRRISSINRLASLTISPGVLYPAFDPGIASYMTTFAGASLGSDKTITVTATAEDSSATVTGAGPTALSLGANVIQVGASAANGQARTYTILVNLIEGDYIASSLAGMRIFLESQAANTPDKPYGVILNGQTGNASGTTLGIMGAWSWFGVGSGLSSRNDITNILTTRGTIYLYEDFKGKYVALDLSGSSSLEWIFHTTQAEADNQAANRACLVSVVLPASCGEIGEYAFYNCVNLKSITLNYDGVAVMKQRTAVERTSDEENVNASAPDALPAEDLAPIGSAQFANVPADCVFYVPASRVQAYKDSPAWSSINDSQFQAIAED
jgi:hypothetical protein